MAAANAADTQALDHIRGRLQQLANTLSSLKRDIDISDPLPSWPAIQTSTQLIFNQLDKLTPLLDDNRTFLTSAHVFPLPTFPRPAQEAVLGQLLRKKLEPAVEDWIEEGNALWTRLEQESGLASSDEDGIREFWEWTATKTLDMSRDMPWGVDYTVEELGREGGVSGVATGLKRELDDGGFGDDDDDDDDDEEDDDDDEEMEDVQTSTNTQKEPPETKPTPSKPTKPPTTLEQILKWTNQHTPSPPH